MRLQTSSKALQPIDRLTSPFTRFARIEAASGILLLVSAGAALIWANSPWEHSFHALWEAQLPVALGGLSVSESLHAWVNDGLMAIFFFLVGLEIKREVLVGELSSFRQAALPFIAAFGGSVVPALFYMSLNRHSEGADGWGIPMATDIAFALGILALLGDRVPSTLKVFVAALAIVDDIFSVLVIAFFYTAHISVLPLLAAFAGVAVAFFMNWLGVRNHFIYLAIGAFVWLCLLESGLHATIAGVLMAFTIPARTYIDKEEFLSRGRAALHHFEGAEPNSADAHDAVHALHENCAMVESPLQRIEHSLQPWSGFLIMPLFAFSNAGVQLPALDRFGSVFLHPVAVGVMFGLLLGKPLGIMLCSWLSCAVGLASLPKGVSWSQMFGASWLCGIGFTMSLFVATLAFPESELLDIAKIGILDASLAASIVGSLILRMAHSRQSPELQVAV
jgi:Na+:H+ antiporter, NhaA family